MKPLLSFAHIICCAILLFGFVYYVLLMVFYFHQGSSITALDAMREDVKIWMERALAFELGSSLGSKEKDAATTSTTTTLIDGLKNSTPVSPDKSTHSS